MDTLGDYGHSFQIKVISCLLKDKNFVLEVSDTLESKYFDSEPNQWLIDFTVDYFAKYNDAPTLEAIKVGLTDVKNDVLSSGIKKNLKESVLAWDSPDLDYTKEKAAEFFKNQKIKAAILKSVDFLERKDYDGIKLVVDDAMKAGSDKNVGLVLNEVTVESRYSEAARATTPTPWTVLNEITDGGFAPGELVVFVAPAGIGKSWALVNVGQHAAKKGLKVVHYTLELNEAYTAMRYDAVATGIPNQQLKFHTEEIQKHMDNLKGSVTVKKCQQNATTVNTLRAHLEKLKMLGQMPDVVIVDYADLLSGPGKERREQLGAIYVDLRGMADEFQIPVYTASQANRSALEADIIEADKISEDYSKIMTADFVISLSRKHTDKVAGTGRWYVIKNRFGPDGLVFPSKMNMSTGKFDLYEEKSSAGVSTQKDSREGELKIRQKLGQRYRETHGKSMG